jgi:phosphoribosylformimino-5-aminoimidazole carboxamide ribotide isomerase
LQCVGLDITGAGATSQYNTASNWTERGKIASMPDVVCCVFKDVNGTKEHTGMHIGGGITADNAGAWLNAGADKVIVTSFVFSGGEFLRANLDLLLRSIGKQHLVLDLSCRKCPDGKYRVVTDRWKNFTTLELNGSTLEMLGASCSEFLIHAVDVEGLRAGIDLELLEILGKYSPIDCVYAGGVASYADIDAIEAAGLSYTIGSALDIFGGDMSYESVVSRHKALQQQGVK